MKILLHSSKTMKPETSSVHELTTPRFMDQATLLNTILQQKNIPELARLMAINDTLAGQVKKAIDGWNNQTYRSAAALTFRGDIYSGLSAGQWNEADAIFAQSHLLILSGLYGVLKPFDEIKPYRLEMGYKLELNDNLRLDTFWEQQLMHALDLDDTYINLTAAEYFKTIKRQLSKSCVISPKFLTVSQKTQQPVFVTVHAKIARGSFANWLIQNKIDDPKKLPDYNLLNYKYDKNLSTELEPVFVCDEFQGLGLSVRLK